MKVQKKRLFVHAARVALTALLATTFAFTACSSDDDDSETYSPPADVVVSGITIVDTDGNNASSVAQESSVNLTATLKPATATDKTIYWTTSSDKVTLSKTETNTKVATITATVAQDATVDEEVTITATSKSNTAAVATYKLTVARASTINLSLALSADEGSLERGKSGDITVTPTATDAADENATFTYTYAWSVKDADDNDVDTIELTNAAAATVTLKALRAATNGTYTVTVTVTATSSAEGTTPKTAKKDYTLTVTDVNYRYTLYDEDFSNADAGNVLTAAVTNGTTRIVDSLSGQTKAFNLYLTGATGNRTGTLLFSNAGFASDTQAKVEFLLKTTYTGGSTSIYRLQDSTGADIFGLWNANTEVSYAIGEATSDVTITTASGVDSISGSTAMTQPAWANSADVQPSTRNTSAWMKVTVEVDFTADRDNVTLTITDAESGTVLVNGATGTTVATNISKLAIQLGKSIGAMALDDILIKSASDEIVFNQPTLTATSGTDAVTELANDGTATLTAFASAHNASAPTTQLAVKYDWEITAGDSVASLSATSTSATTENATITLTAANSTVNDTDVTVQVTATLASDDTQTATATKTVTVKADEILLSDITAVTAEGSVTTVEEESTLQLTLTGGTKDSGYTGSEEVTYVYSSSNAAAAKVSNTGLITGVSATTEPVTITVTATLGDIVKTATFTLTEVTAYSGTRMAKLIAPADAQSSFSAAGRAVDDCITVIKLSGTSVTSAITADADVATISVAGTDYTAKALAAVSADATEIPVYFTGATVESTSEVGMTLLDSVTVANSDSVTKSQEASSSNAACVYTVKSVQLFEDEATVNTTSGVKRGGAYCPTLQVGDTPTNIWVAQNTQYASFGYTTGSTGANSSTATNKYFDLQGGGTASGARWSYSAFDLSAPSAGTYILEFDANITPGNTTANAFVITSLDTAPNSVATGQSADYILKLEQSAATSTTWNVYSGTATSDATVTLDGTNWAHFKLVVTIDTSSTTSSQVVLSVTKCSDSSVSLITQNSETVSSVTLSCNSSTGIAKWFLCDWAKNYRSISMDNVVVFAEN